jgi:hypothetical protein
LFKQERLQILNVKKIKSSSKINLNDVSWWMFIKKARRLKIPIIVKLSKKKMHFFKYKRKVILSCTKTWLKKMKPSSIWKMYSFKMNLLKIRNLKHKYRTTKIQLPIKSK